MKKDLNIGTAVFLLALFAVVAVLGTTAIVANFGKTPWITGLAIGEVTVTVGPTVSISISNSPVAFGNLDAGSWNATTDNDPLPLIIENTGNVWANISVSGTSIGIDPFPGNEYRIACQNASECTGQTCTNGTSCNDTWWNVPNTTADFLWGLNWNDTGDSVEVEINLSPDQSESPGTGSSTLTFTAVQVS